MLQSPSLGNAHVAEASVCSFRAPVRDHCLRVRVFNGAARAEVQGLGFRV